MILQPHSLSNRRNPWNYNNALVFVCNFAPVERWEMGVGAPVEGVYKRIFSTYPDGSPLEIETVEELCDGRRYKLIFNLRPYESCIFEVPYKESTPEEIKKEKAVRSGIKKAHEEVKNDFSHVPDVKVPEDIAAKPAAKKSVKKPAAKK